MMPTTTVRAEHFGPLHTQAKSRDHEMVRAFDYHPKAVLWVLAIHFVWGWVLKHSVKCEWTILRNRCIFY